MANRHYITSFEEWTALLELGVPIYDTYFWGSEEHYWSIADRVCVENRSSVQQWIDAQELYIKTE